MSEAPEFLRTAGPVAETPSAARRIFAVWLRHRQVYFKNLVANGLPPFLEPLFFLLAIGIGLGRHLGKSIGGMEYAVYMAPGLPAMSAMFTASYETTIGTLVRLKYAKVYAALQATPATTKEIFWGEIFWCGTKGLMFSACIVAILWCFGIGLTPAAVLIPPLGFLTGMIFAGMGFIVTSFVREFSNFNFYFTGVLSPLAFFSGLFFPVEQLPSFLPWLAWALPLSHVISLMRACLCGTATLGADPRLHLLYLVLLTALVCPLGVRLLQRRAAP